MKTKTVTIQIPSKFNFMAVQPWGTILLAERQPVIYEENETEAGIAYWHCTIGNYTELDNISVNERKDWRKTLKKI